MIMVLSSNDGHCKSLENVVNDMEMFKDIVFQIIDDEMKKRERGEKEENNKYWNEKIDNACKIGGTVGTVITGIAGVGTTVAAVKWIPTIPDSKFYKFVKTAILGYISE